MIYRYYAILRPIGLGTVPKGFVNHHNYNERHYVPSLRRSVWGYVDYDHPIQACDCNAFELVEEVLP